MNISLTILTCDKRQPVVTDSLRYSDCPLSIRAVTDSQYTNSLEPLDRAKEAFRGILEDFLVTDDDYLLYLEDDLIVSPYIWHNLQNFESLKSQEVDWLSLCDIDKGAVISRNAAEFMLAVGDTDPSILTENGYLVLRYAPSIVQHNRGGSVITGKETRSFASDFSPNFKADIV